MRLLRLKASGTRLEAIGFSILILMNVTFSFGQSLADSAAKAYEKQEFSSAAKYYEKILDEGRTSAKLYYNLGNAYYKSNRLGKAIYNYELAKKLSPGDADIKNNLNVANSKLVDKIESKENYFAGAIKSGIFSLFSTTGWAWLSILFLFFALLCFFLFISSANLFLKRAGFLIGLLCTVCFFIAFGVGYGALHDLNKKTQAIVIAPTAQVLNAPSAGSKSKFTLHEGTKLTVLSTNDEWTSIQLANGNEGWIKTSELGLF